MGIGSLRMSRARDSSRLWAKLLVLAGILFSSGAVQAKETCKKCEFVACIKDMIARNEALISGYQGLLRKYGPTWTENGSAIDAVNFDHVDDKNQVASYAKLSVALLQFGGDVEEMNKGIPAPTACHIEGGLEASTDPQTCVTEGLANAKSQLPCDEIYKSVEEHEAYHAAACKARRGGAKARTWVYSVPGSNLVKIVPYSVLTPGGLANEEIAAYTAQNAKLNALLKEAQKKCKIKFSGVTVDCTLRQVRMGQKLEGEVCGDPTKSAWTIYPTYFAEGPYIPPVPPSQNKPFKTDCLAAGSEQARKRLEILHASPGGGWFCEIQEGDKPVVTIRWVRMPQCQGPRDQSYVAVVKLEDSCSDDDSQPSRPPQEPPPRLPNS